MAIEPKILGQYLPAPSGDAYSPGAGNQTTVSTILMHNTDGSDTDTAEIWLGASAAANSTTNKICNINVPADGTIILTVGLTLSGTDLFRVASTNSTVNFQFFGIEETP